MNLFLAEKFGKVNESSNNLTIKLEDGDMKVEAKEVTDGAYDIKISYGSYKCLINTTDNYKAHSSKGDTATLLNMLIQQLFIDGVIKSK